MNSHLPIQLNPFAISNLIIIVLYFPLFLFIFIKGKTLLTRIFSLHILTVFGWGIGGFLIAITQDYKTATFLWKISYVDVLLVPVFFQHVVLLMTNNKNK